MHSLRRTILRAALSAAATTPKPQTTGAIARFAVAHAPKAITTRFFGSSIVRLNEKTQSSGEAKGDAGEAAEAVEAAMGAAAEGGSTNTPEAPNVSSTLNEADYAPEPNGVYGVFVWNIPYRSTEREMFDTFTRFGKVHSLNIGRDARGLSRGFAFVYYQEKAEAMEAIRGADGAFWQGRRIGAKPKQPSDGASGSSSAGKSARPKSSPTSSLYVGNIPYEATDTELNQLFSGLPNVLDVRVAIDKATGWPRGFAHADFSDVESATKAMEKLASVSIQGRQLRIDYSESKKPQSQFVAANEQPGPDDKVL